MSVTTDDRAFRERMERMEALLQQAKQFPDPQVRGQVQEIVQSLLDLHAAALEKIVEAVAAADSAGPALIENLAQDDLVGNVLLLYGLHPIDLETRVRQALEQVRPLLRSHGGNVELLKILNGVVRLRLQGSCDGCPSSAQTLKLAIEEAIYAKAPDIAGIEVDGVVETKAVAEPTGRARVALAMVPA
jgi:Fe-S cluster biogenesis protein NfuA